MEMFAADFTRPYWSTVTCDTFDPEPYVPAITPDAGKTDVFKVPKSIFDALRCESADPSPSKWIIASVTFN
jgi:hypothetical protein